MRYVEAITRPFADRIRLNCPVVSVRRYPDRVAVTWLGVFEYGTSHPNTFQIELFYNGEVRVTWLTVTATRGLVGLSPGGGVPVDFLASDVSAYPACGPGPARRA